MSRQRHQRHRRGERRPPNLIPKAAPGNLHLVQAFVNTRESEENLDDLSSPAALSAWLSRHGLLPTGTPLDEASWRVALDVREGLRAIFLAHSGGSLRPGAVERLNDAIAEVRPCFQFDDGGELGLESPDAGWTGALSRMLSVAMEAMKDDRWERLKACWNPACRAIFYDTSPNRSGKWCTVKRCGNRANTRTYRKRNS